MTRSKRHRLLVTLATEFLFPPRPKKPGEGIRSFSTLSIISIRSSFRSDRCWQLISFFYLPPLRCARVPFMQPYRTS